MADTTVPAAPLLATIPRVELASVGWWDISNADDWHPSAEDLANAVAALDCPAVRRPVLKFGHTGKGGEGDPAIGLVDNLAVADDGQTLVGDFVGVPAWLAGADAQGRSVIASAYPDRSGEFQHDHVCQLGHVHPFVVHAVALLGVKQPGIGTLQSLYDLYAKAPEKENPMPKASGVLSASVTVDQVRSAYYAGPAATNYNLWIREMFIDPPELIVQSDADDTLTRVSFAVSGDDVEFGDPQAVKVKYVNARAAQEPPVLAFASCAESRTHAPRTTQTPSAAGVEVTGEEDTPVSDDFMKGLRARLGLAEDADEAAVQAALDKAVPDPAPEAAPEPVKDVADAPQPVAASSGTGTVTLDAGAYEALQRNAELGALAHERQVVEDRDALVSASIREGRIPPARKEFWLAQLKADPVGAKATLASFPAGSIPLASIGYAAGTDASEQEIPENDPKFANWSFT